MRSFISTFIAQPRTRQEIRKDAYDLRKRLGLLNEPRFPIMNFLEKTMPLIDPEFSLDVVKDNEMGTILAEAIPEEHTIKVKESVYKGACFNHFWHRMTMAHELGHYIYHQPGSIILARIEPGTKIPSSCNPERQADIFAAELMIPINLIKKWTPKEIAKKCNVSFRAAELQYMQLKFIHHSRANKTAKLQKVTWRKMDKPKPS